MQCPLAAVVAGAGQTADPVAVVTAEAVLVAQEAPAAQVVTGAEVVVKRR